jgi:competence protein ComEA
MEKGQFPNFASATGSFSLSQEQTSPLSAVTPAPNPISMTPTPTPEPKPTLFTRKRLTRLIALILTLLLAGAILFIWFTSPASSTPPVISQQQFGNSSQNSPSTTNGDLHVYVLGAVKHPGVYVLPPGSRVYQLIQAAGGALPEANLVALNLAATLTDGQEVYVLAVGEIPPTYLGGVPGPGASGTTTSGQLININTASVTEMQQALHISSASAQKIVDYRTQHGPYTSIDQLLQAVSRSIYDKIKNLVTI